MSPSKAAAAILIASLLGAATPAEACQAIDVAGNNNSVSCATIKDGTSVRKAGTGPKVNVAVNGDDIEVDVIVRRTKPQPGAATSPVEDEVVEGNGEATDLGGLGHALRILRWGGSSQAGLPHGPGHGSAPPGGGRS